MNKGLATRPSIYRYFLTVLVWLMVWFVAWFLSAKILNIPLVWLSEWFLHWLTNGLVIDVDMRSGQAYKVINQQFIIYTNIPPPGEQPVFATAMPLIYGYGFALFGAMTFATPKDESHKWREIGIAYLIFLIVQLLGITVKMYMDLVFHSPPEISQYFPWVLGHLDLLGLSYQIVTLVLPPVTPLVLWVLFNTPFIEQLVDRSVS